MNSRACDAASMAQICLVERARVLFVRAYRVCVFCCCLGRRTTGLIGGLDIDANLVSKNSGAFRVGWLHVLHTPIGTCGEPRDGQPNALPLRVVPVGRWCAYPPPSHCPATADVAGLLESGLVNVTIAALGRVIKTGDFEFPVSVRLLNPFDCPIRIKSLDLRVRAWAPGAPPCMRGVSAAGVHGCAGRRIATCPRKVQACACNFTSSGGRADWDNTTHHRATWSPVATPFLQVTYQNVSIGFFNNSLAVVIPPGRTSRTPFVNVSALKGARVALFVPVMVVCGPRVHSRCSPTTCAHAQATTWKSCVRC